MRVDENSIIEYQFIINYEKVSILQKELLNYIEENSLYLGFNQEFMNSGMEIIRFGGGEFGDEIKSLRRYVIETTIVNKSLDLFEQTGKGILITNGYSWDECKTFGHNVLRIYQQMNEVDKSKLIDTISENYEIENEEQFLAYLSSFTQVRDLDGNLTRLLANISTRYPGENYSQYSTKDIKFIAHISTELFKIYKNYMPEKYRIMYEYENKFMPSYGCVR